MDFNEKLFHRLMDYKMVYPDGRKVFTFRQQRGSRDEDLKPEAAGASGLSQMPLTAFFYVWEFVKIRGIIILLRVNSSLKFGDEILMDFQIDY